jgi:hypothetical protein
LVVGGGVVLRKIITVIIFALLPVDVELSLGNSVLDPIKTHIHCLGSLYFGALIRETICCRIVGCDSGRFRLFSAQFFQDLSDVCCFLPVMEEGSNFGF